MADKPLKVYAIEDNGGDRKYWREVGVAFRNKDGSLNLKLYMLPLSQPQHPRTERRQASIGGIRWTSQQ
jgi:hypothetical protein